MNTLDDKFKKCIIIDNMPTIGNTPHIIYHEKYVTEDWFDIRKYISDNLINTYTPKPKSKLYFHKGCQVPRYKVRNWGKTNKISITIKPELADAQFINAGYFKKHLLRRYGEPVSRVAFIAYLKTFSANVYANTQELIDTLDLNACEYVMTAYGFSKNHGFINSYSYNGQKFSNHSSGASYVGYMSLNSAAYTTINNCLKDQNIFLDIHVIKHINENSATIDSAMYEQLQGMFSSNDMKNHKVALEVLTNCNTNESLFYILLLFQEFGATTIWNLKERTHVGFKSLIEYIGERRWEYLDYDTIANILMDKDVLTFEMVKYFAKHVKENMIENYNTNHFHISTITVSDQIKKYLNPTQQSTQELPQPQEDNVEFIEHKE